MKLFDSHCHIEDRGSFEADRSQVITRARQAGVCCMMVVGTTLERSRQAVALADATAGVIASIGIHPHDAASASDAVLDELAGLAANPNVRAVGECGLDFNRMHSPQKIQEHWLAEQVTLARRLELPLIFHERDSEGRFLEMLKTLAPEGLCGVVHCFSGNRSELEGYLDLGLSIGITGILTHKKRGEELRELALDVPLDRILIETDAPYLTPSPERNRHKRNEPAFVARVLDRLSALRGISPATLADQLFANTCRLFAVTDQEVAKALEEPTR